MKHERLHRGATAPLELLKLIADNFVSGFLVFFFACFLYEHTKISPFFIFMG